jgi:hypothetical protein
MTKTKRGKTKSAVNNSDSEEEMSQPTGAATPAPSQSGQQSGSAATSSQGNANAYTWNNSNPKMTKMLEEDKSNFAAWHEAIVNCANQKGVRGAVDGPMPGSVEDSAVKHFLQQSVPKIWEDEVTDRPSAYDFIQWIRSECTGGKNTGTSAKWEKTLQQGMKKGETVRQWCHRVISLSNALKRNCANIEDHRISDYMVKGLPAALQNDAWAYTTAEQPPRNMMKIIMNALDNLGYEDKPLDESVRYPVVAAAAVPAQGGVLGPHASAGAALGAGAIPGAGAGTPAVEQASAGPFSPNAGGKGRGAGRGRRPKEELHCHICNSAGHFWRQCNHREAFQAMLQQRKMQAASMGPAAWWGHGGPQQISQTWWEPRGGPQPSAPSSAGASSVYHYPTNQHAFPGWQLPPPPPPSAGEVMCISLNVFTPTSHGAISSSWLVDSGASVHLVNDLSLLHNPVMHAQPLPLHLATSDAKGGIIASGSVCLVNARQEVMWLHNVQCVPSAHSNLLSVTGAIQDGATFLTDTAGGYTALRGPDGWSGRISRSTGLFFLEVVSPVRWQQTGSRHIGPNAAVSHFRKGHACQDRLLWHARLGHPGANSMARFDKEDLVKGIGVSLAPCAACPTQCESCIQGKHVRPCREGTG